ncbi:MAG: winged helix-turn-helix transcriptional regulator [Candidatus Korarchaeota archaeon NZ13-K]|nr:MAG: winged helix-turn-helix transcriptional regulator [Candidatus Korarchaeota archaeon NZ13-K]
MKRTAKVLLGIALLLIPLSSIAIGAEPPQEVTITRMVVTAELFENSSVKVTVIAEIKVPRNFTGVVRAVMFPVVPIGISMENPEKGISDARSLSRGIYAQRVSTQSFGDAILVGFEEGLKPGEARNISFSFTLKPTTVLAKFDDSYRFAYRFYKPNVTLDYNKSVMEVILPRGAGVTRIGQEGALSMDPLSERLTAIWSPFPAPRGGGWDFILEFKIMSQLAGQPVRTDAVPQQTPSEQMIPILLISNAFTASLTVFVTTLARRLRYGRGRGLPTPIEADEVDEETLLKLEEALEKLDKDERSILEIIHRNNGRIEQKDLPELTGFSKSKVSRVLKRLDSMRFIRRVSQGKTKIVELNPIVSRVLEGSAT